MSSYFNRNKNIDPLNSLGSEGRKKQYDERGWKYDDTIKGFNRDGSKIKTNVKENYSIDEIDYSKGARTKIPNKIKQPFDISVLTKGISKIPLSSHKEGIIDKPDVTKPDAPKTDWLGKGMAGLNVATDLITNNGPDIDTSGKTDYSNTSNSDATGGVMKTFSDTASMAMSGMEIGGVPGAIIGGVVGLGKNLISGGETKRKLALAKRKNANRKRYYSSLHLDDISKEGEDNNQKNIDYINNMKFKRTT